MLASLRLSSFNNSVDQHIQETTSEVFKEAVEFDKPIENVNKANIAIYVSKLVPHGLIIALPSLFQLSLETLALIISSRHGGAVSLACFRIVLILNIWLVTIPVQGILEKVARSCREAYANQNYTLVKRNLFQGLCMLVLLYGLIVLPLYFSTEWLLRKLGYTEGFYRTTSTLLFWLLPSDFIRRICELLSSILGSQGIETPIFLSIGFNWIIALFMVYFLCFASNYSIQGWFVCRYIFDLSNLVFVIILYFTELDRNSVGFPSRIFMFSNFKKFVKDCIAHTAKLFLEWAGYEIFHILVIFTVDVNQVAIDAALANIYSYIFIVSFGISKVSVTRIKILIKDKLFNSAKNICIATLVCLACAGFITAVLVFLGRSKLFNVFAQSDQAIKDHMNQIWLLFCFLLVIGFTEPFIFIQAKLLGASLPKRILQGVFLIGLQVVLGVYFLRKGHGISVLLIDLVINLFVAISVLAFLYYFKNWFEINLEELSTLVEFTEYPEAVHNQHEKLEKKLEGKPDTMNPFDTSDLNIVPPKQHAADHRKDGHKPTDDKPLFAWD